MYQERDNVVIYMPYLSCLKSDFISIDSDEWTLINHDDS